MLSHCECKGKKNYSEYKIFMLNSYRAKFCASLTYLVAIGVNIIAFIVLGDLHCS